MIHFEFELLDGVPIHEQISQRAERMVLRGILREGDNFPSVREISKSLKVNPNTVQKAIGNLKTAGFLKSYPGKGLKVAIPESVNSKGNVKELSEEITLLITKAKKLGVNQEMLIKKIIEEGKKYEI